VSKLNNASKSKNKVGVRATQDTFLLLIHLPAFVDGGKKPDSEQASAKAAVGEERSRPV
jgi:hypothetical protein